MSGCEGRVKVVVRSFGKVSVVQIARAAASQESWVEERVAWAVGRAERILEMGRLYQVRQVSVEEKVVLGCLQEKRLTAAQ